MAAPLHLKIRKGSTFTRTVTLTGKDLTGFGAKLQIRPGVESDIVLAEIDAAGIGGITISGDTMTLVFTDEATAGWAWTRGVYDLVVTDTQGRDETILEGRVEAVRNVTR